MPKTFQLQGYIVARYLSAILSVYVSGKPTNQECALATKPEDLWHRNSPPG